MSVVFKEFVKSISVLQHRRVLRLTSGFINYSTIDKTFVKQIFERLDSNKDGLVDKQDLRKEVLGIFLYSYTHDENNVDEAFTKLDKAKKGYVSLEDVDAYLKSIELPSRETITSEFNKIDVDHDGHISLDDVLRRYDVHKGDSETLLYKRDFKMMGAGKSADIGKVTLDDYIGHQYYKHFLASVFKITDYFGQK